MVNSAGGGFAKSFLAPSFAAATGFGGSARPEGLGKKEDKGRGNSTALSHANSHSALFGESQSSNINGGFSISG
jgi:hypothetical protein